VCVVANKNRIIPIFDKPVNVIFNDLLPLIWINDNSLKSHVAGIWTIAFVIKFLNAYL